jgi:hypothetical protein
VCARDLINELFIIYIIIKDTSTVKYGT